MRQSINIRVNHLPSPTWKRLHVNQSDMEIEPEFGRIFDRVEKCVPEGITVSGEKPESWTESMPQEGGMGPEFTELLENPEAISCYIRIGAGKTVSQPYHIVYHCKEGDSYLERQFIYAEAGSKSTIILECSSETDSKGFLGIQSFCYLEAGAEVHFIKVQTLSHGFLYADDMGSYCEEEACQDIVKINAGAGKSFIGMKTVLQGKKSTVHSKLGYLCGGSQQLDINDYAVHIGKNTESNMETYGVLKEKADKLYRGTIDMRCGASGSKGSEQENVLVLSADARNRSVPLILCREDDVEGNHGATIGKLDDAMLFYMESRGILKEQAETMAAMGKINGILPSIPDENLVEKIKKHVKEVLHDESVS